MKKLEKNKGITLVALIITIIVMLILVGVSVNIVIDSEIATTAEGAAEKSRAADIREEIALVVGNNKSAQYTGSTVKNKTQLVTELANKEKLTPEEVELLKMQDIITIGGIEVNFSELKVGNAKKITPGDYGKEVTNYTVTGYEGKWEILYADDINVYLIATERVTDPIYNSNNLGSPVSAGTYSEGSTLLSNTTQYPAAEKWLYGYLKSDYTSTEVNMQSTVFMLDSTGVWNDTYKNEYADWAIGSPTLEMLVASMNAVLNTNVSVEVINSVGYSTPNFEGVTISGDYVWNHESYYFLTCPSSGYEDNMVLMKSGFGSDKYNSWKMFRPVVCLNSDVTLKANAENTTFTLEW